MKRIYLEAGRASCAHDQTVTRARTVGNTQGRLPRDHAGRVLATAMVIVLFGMAGAACATTTPAAATTQCQVIDGRRQCPGEAGTVAQVATAGANDSATQVAAISAADAQIPAFADGEDALALGNASNALGDGTMALGGGSLALDRDATAIGHNAAAAGESAIAVGGVTTVFDYDANGFVIGQREQATQASGVGATAVGGGAVAGTPYASAIGSGASASGVQSTALGYRAQTSSDGATAVGGLSSASGFLSTAGGYSSRASADTSTAFGYRARSDGASSVAVGDTALASGAQSVVVGGVSNFGSITAATGLGGIALGSGAQSQSDYAIAIGYDSNVFPNAPGNTDAVAIGHSAGSFAPRTVSLGGFALASGDGGISIGHGSTAYNENSVALGARAMTSQFNGDSTVIGADAQANGVDAVAIGYGAKVGSWVDDAWNRSASSAVALGAHSYAFRSNTVSVGDVQAGLTRQITSVAAGTEATDAVNVAQLDTVRAATSRIDGYLAVTPATTDAAAASAQGQGAMALGGASSALGASATAVGFNASSVGQGSAALGSRAVAAGERSVAIASGSRAAATGASAIGADSSASGVNSTAMGRQTNSIGENGVALGYNSFVRESGSNAVALGANAGASGADSVALGSGSRTYDANTVSVGSGNGRGGPATRRIVNVGAGTIASASTDAINGGQLFQSLSNAASFLGGGAAIGAQGVFVAPTYVIQGASYNNVGAALTALDSKVSELDARSGSTPTSTAARTASLRTATVPAVAATAVSDMSSNVASTAGNATAAVQGTPTAAMDGSITPAATSTAVGTAAVANHVTGTAIGGSAYAHGPNDTAIGSNARVNADGSTAVGANTQIAAVATNAVAMGEGAQVTAASGTAIGQGARATAQGAVALGQGSVADRANTVSVGSVGGERQVANVAAGTRATDAVNKGQLDSGVAAANSYTDSRYNAMADSFESYQGDIEDRLRRQNRRLDRQGAMSSAMLNMSASVAGIASQNRIGAGVGFQNGESALSVGYQRAISPRATLTVGGALSGDDSSIGVGAGFGW
ncbi:YadA-like family protein [Xanthomonas euvesicatoria]|uniref:YadA-like family protein n=1 Tax=Xanthomonas euvesicatoria TaxID=456327 RepID=UPI0010AD0822|nr:YadA-like family protein [Xanthomonas euvesicatoria]TKA13885.1 adhesin [Xanthomonas euvesicatoria pv. citrumelonis]